MVEIAKTIIMIGVFTIFVGMVLYLFGKIPGAGKLPGDIFIKKENFSFYFPVTTSILVSIILSLLLYFWGKK